MQFEQLSPSDDGGNAAATDGTGGKIARQPFEKTDGWYALLRHRVIVTSLFFRSLCNIITVHDAVYVGIWVAYYGCMVLGELFAWTGSRAPHNCHIRTGGFLESGSDLGALFYPSGKGSGMLCYHPVTWPLLMLQTGWIGATHCHNTLEKSLPNRTPDALDSIQYS